MQTKISVIMPVHNQITSYLQQAVASIMEQSFADFELILIDDGSTSQDCIDLLEKFSQSDSRIRLFRNEINLGIIKSRNKGLRESTGQYIAVLDSDDIASKERLLTQFNYLENNPGVALCGSWSQIIDEQGKSLGQKKTYTESQDIKNNIIRYNFITHSTCFFRKEIIQEIGYYNENSLKTEDYDFLLRIIGKFPVRILPQFLCSYRINTKGDSLSNNKLQEKYALKARFRALASHSYPRKDYLKTALPILMYFLLPTNLKQILLKKIWKTA